MNTKDYVETLTLDEMARWMTLFEGVNLIFGELEKQNLDQDFEEDKRLFNRIDRSLNKYIRDKYITVKADIVIDYGEEPEDED